MQISESKEKYVEAIYSLTNYSNNVLAVDVANYLNYSKASVSCALKKLEQMGLVERGIRKSLALTEEGRKCALQLCERFAFFYSLLVNSGLEEKQAKEESYKLMHAMSEDGFQKLKMHTNME